MMGISLSRPPVSVRRYTPNIISILSVLFLLGVVVWLYFAMRITSRLGLVGAVAASLARPSYVTAVDLSWHAPSATALNNLTDVIGSVGVYGFIYNNTALGAGEYGTYDWCNMPHVRTTEYQKPPAEYRLKYVEVIHRHHKRTVYASNSFPVESYGWNCDDEGLFYFGQPKSGRRSAHTYWQGYISPTNPFVPSGFLGTCQFPQITAEGLEDSWQHGKDLYEVYHDLLGFLPDNVNDYITFRVTQNVITSEVAGMVINGMFGDRASVPLLIAPSGFDSLEPTYVCPTSSVLFAAIKSGSNWTAHLTAASGLYSILDNISGVSATDSGFHGSFDHYYDNLSARQCHGKPLPCKLINGVNSTTCVTQDIANEVYRLGNYEYSYIYRDDSRSLAASSASFGVWIGELTTHIRANMNGSSNILYRHNVAHDGSISRLLSILQLDKMVWPGMGSEIVFELYKKETNTEPTTILQSKNSSDSTISISQHYVRVLWGGQPLISSNPSFGVMSMVPVETFLAYLEGLVGVGANLVYGECNGSVSFP